MTYRELKNLGTGRLEKAGITEAEHDALALLLFCFGFSDTDYLLRNTQEAAESGAENYLEAVRVRTTRVPLQRILGQAPFYGYEFYINEDVLIPRFDTEVLVHEVLSDVREEDVSLLDLCTGSGCIAVTLKLEGGYRLVSASDISGRALEAARANAEKYGQEIHFIRSDLFDHIRERYDVIVSNPPYIETEEIGYLEPEVKEHDPMQALDGGEDGLFFYRHIIAEAPQHLNEGGRIFFEIGESQGESVKKLLEEAGFSDVRIIRDLAGLYRVVKGIYHV